MSKNYIVVRKTHFDTSWHAVYLIDGQERWDRVTEAEALKIARKMPPHVPARLPVRQRESEPARGESWPQTQQRLLNEEYEELSGAGAHPVGAPSWGQYYADRDKEKNRQ